MSAPIVRDAVVTVEGVDYYAQPCTIESTSLGFNDRGMFDCWLHVKGAGWGVGIGGYCLDSYNSEKKEREPHIAMPTLVTAILRTVGVSTWEELRGKRIHVLRSNPSAWGSTSQGIASADLDRALVYADLFKALAVLA